MKSAASQIVLAFEGEQPALVDLTQVSTILGVSTATVRNWVKSSQLKTKPLGDRLMFDADHIEEIKQQLLSGELGRLHHRANKKRSSATFIPEEYSTNKEVAQAIGTLVSQYRKEQFELRPFLLSVIMKLLNGRINKPIQSELDWWRLESSGESPRLAIALPREAPDILGLLYQSLLAEGKKSETGAYYTPPEIARSMIKDNVKPNSLFLDPCCGTGLFLLQAAEIISNPKNIWGYDTDEYAVRIARLNLILRFPNANFTPNIFCRNGLLATQRGFDVVATNPPWGAHFSNEERVEIQALYGTRSNESFTFFIQAGLRSLKENGALSLLLPESFLNIKTHSETRRAILHDTCVQKTVSLGRVFKKVFTPVVRLDVRKAIPHSEHSFTAHSKDGSRIFFQKRMKEKSEDIFDVLNNSQDHKIIDFLYNCPHSTLKGHAEWALGIVTGNNSRFLSHSPTNETEEILVGKDLRRFVACDATRYIHFQREKFQQVAPTAMYRSPEKLLYRFISKELVFSYDDKQRLALNSANILIPRMEGYSIKLALAFLNSKVLQFLFQKKFKALKILRGDLEKLPFPRVSPVLNTALSKRVDLLLEANIENHDRKAAYKELNLMTMDAFGLSDSQKRYIESSVVLSSSYLLFRN